MSLALVLAFISKSLKVRIMEKEREKICVCVGAGCDLFAEARKKWKRKKAHRSWEGQRKWNLGRKGSRIPRYKLWDI